MKEEKNMARKTNKSTPNIVVQSLTYDSYL